MTENTYEVLEAYLEETAERLDAVESGLLQLENIKECTPGLIHSIFRDAHSIKAGANLLKLRNIEELSHKLENVLEMIRKGKIHPSEHIITACLESVDKLRELIENVNQSEHLSIRLHTAMLEMAIKRTTEEQE